VDVGRRSAGVARGPLPERPQQLMESSGMTIAVSLEDLVLDSAKDVFDTMIFVPLEACENREGVIEEAAFLATITFIGQIKGCFSLCLGQDGARAVAAGMLCLEEGAQLKESDLVDAMGDAANMIMGGVKTRIQKEIRDLEISIPSVIQGRELVTRLGDGPTRIAIPATIGGQHAAELSLLYRHLQEPQRFCGSAAQ